MSLFLALICLILTAILAVSLYFNFKHAKLLLEIQDSIEQSLDDLDAIYGRIAEILEKPVFFDSIEVRQVIADIDEARQTVLKIANVLVKSVTTDEDSNA
jgi:hypothetical protein